MCFKLRKPASKSVRFQFWRRTEHLFVKPQDLNPAAATLLWAKSKELKFDLCCAARLLFRFGLSVGNAGYLSISVGENRMLVNRFGPSFATMTPADVLTMDFNGNVLEHDPSVKPYVNETIHLHGVIHRYNPHIAAVAHTHPRNTVTWTTFRKLPQTFDQESCLLADDIAIVDEDFTGLAQSEDRVRPYAQALGKKQSCCCRIMALSLPVPVFSLRCSA